VACEWDTSFGIMSAPFEGNKECILNVGGNELEKYDKQ